MFGFLYTPSPMEMMVILALGVLLFGKRLPEVGKQLGKGLLEFKRGVSGEGEGAKEKKSEGKEIKAALNTDAVLQTDALETGDTPKFEPPT